MVEMKKLVKFSTNSYFLGRNGTFISSGLELSLASNPDGGYVVIEPTTSRNLTGRCNIVVPAENLQGLIDMLTSLKKHYDRDIHT